MYAAYLKDCRLTAFRLPAPLCMFKDATYSPLQIGYVIGLSASGTESISAPQLRLAEPTLNWYLNVVLYEILRNVK